MKFIVCHFKPKGPLHLGERQGWREGSGYLIHSDTLFSAFCHAHLLLYGEDKLSQLLDLFANGNPPFLISSVFYCWQNIYFFPVPVNQIAKTKQTKKIQFVEKVGFEMLLRGDVIETIKPKIKYLPAEKEPYTPWILDNVPRISLSRLSKHPVEDGGYFHFGEVFFRDDVTLFFLILYRDKNYQPRVEATFRLLADEGIGGDRSSGKGIMGQPRFDEIDINIPEDGDGVVTLSLYYPADGVELTDIQRGFYKLIERKGYIFSPVCKSFRRKSVRMFTEGSVFSAKPFRKGCLVSVKPQIFTQHEVYRYGYIFTLPCKLEVCGAD